MAKYAQLTATGLPHGVLLTVQDSTGKQVSNLYPEANANAPDNRPRFADGTGSIAPAAYVPNGTYTVAYSGGSQTVVVSGASGTPADSMFIDLATQAELDAAGTAASGTYRPHHGVLPERYALWRKALGKTRVGTSDSKLLVLGDSTSAFPTAGSWPMTMKKMLDAYYVPASDGFGVPSNASNSDADARFTLGANFAKEGGFGFANNSCYSSNIAGSTLTFTPGVDAGSVDTFDIYFQVNNQNLNFTAQATGGSSVGAPVTGSQVGVAKMTVTAAAAGTGNSVVITAGSVGRIRVLAIEAYHSTTRRVRVGTASLGGITLQAFVNTGSWATQAMLNAYAPNLTIIALGINDDFNPTYTAAHLANLTTLVGWVRAAGSDVLLRTAPPINPTGTGAIPAANAQTLAEQKSLAASLGLGLIDVSERWIDYATAQPLGYYSDTLIHPSDFGYADIGQAAFQALVAL